MPLASGLRFSSGAPDASLLYLLNISSAFILDEFRDTSLTYDNVTSHEFGYHLGQLINSYLIAGQAYDSVPGGRPSDYVSKLTTNATFHTYKEVYTISIPWFMVCLIAALVLFLGSVAGAIVCHMSRTPEILGYASLAIRDSKHVDSGSRRLGDDQSI